MSIKMLKIHDSSHRIYRPISPGTTGRPIFHYGCTQEITDSAYIKQWLDYLKR